jgi:ABC-2 type transport system ATP-binding protein
MASGMIRCDRVIVERSGQMVIDRLSLLIGAGETLAVIGRSGAGKSTFLEALATAIPVRGGDIAVDGHSVRRDPDAVRARLGYVPSQLAAWPGVRADEFLALFGSSAGLTGHGLQAAVNRALDLADLKGRGAAPIDSLPAGQAKLLLIGRALLHAPDLLVLDDPFGSLDPRQRQSVERLISDLQLGGRTVVAAIDDARVPDCFTHLAVLSEGRLVERGPATFAAFAGGRAWRYRLHCNGQAESAADAVGRLVHRVEALDATILDCMLEFPPATPTGSPPRALSEIVAALVRAGITVEAASLHPHWTEQLVEPLG